MQGIGKAGQESGGLSMELKANHKFIDASCVAHLIAAGEKYADTLTFSVDRYYHGKDLSGCMFVIRGVNSAGALSLQTLAQETADTAILLTWDISPAFTAVSGMLALEIVCYDNDSMILKYTVTPMQVRESVLEEYSGGVDAIEEALKEMEQILEETRAVSVKLPIIQNGTWWLYHTDSGAYEDSGLPAQGAAGEDGQDGKDGADGAPGADGRDGQDGADGKSAYQIWLDAGNAGTESDFLASLKGEKGDTGLQGERGEKGETGQQGEQGQKGEKGDPGDRGLQGVPGEKGEKGDAGVAGKDGTDGFSPIANVVKDGSVITITITDKNGTTTATLTEGAAVDLAPYAKVIYVDEKVQELSDSLTYTLQEHTLSITHLEDKSHTHENITSLNSISPADITNIHDTFPAQIYALQQSLGDIQTALADIVEV